MTQFKPPNPPFLSLRLKLLTLTNCFPNLNRYHPSDIHDTMIHSIPIAIKLRIINYLGK